MARDANMGVSPFYGSRFTNGVHVLYGSHFLSGFRFCFGSPSRYGFHTRIDFAIKIWVSYRIWLAEPQWVSSYFLARFFYMGFKAPMTRFQQLGFKGNLASIILMVVSLDLIPCTFLLKNRRGQTLGDNGMLSFLSFEFQCLC